MSVKDFRKSNSKFQFHNENPRGLVRTNDCVIRAITTAEEGNWHTTFNNLYKIAAGQGRMISDPKVWGYHLEQTGWSKRPQPRKSNNKKYTVHELIDLYPKGRFIISVAGHLTTVLNGKIYDTWDCGFKAVGNFWAKGII